MEFNALPIWASAIGRLFGGDPEGEPSGGAAGAGTGTPPEPKPESEQPININPDDHAKAIRERDSAQSELAALQQEKQERDEAEEQARAATRSKEENLTKEVETLQKDNQALSLVNTENLLELAVLKNSKYQWINPNNVVKLIDRSDIKIDAKTGKVEGVEAALKTLAKDSPELLKVAAENENGNGQQQQSLPGQPSGGTPGSSQDTNAKQAKRNALIGRFGSVLTP